MKVGRGVLIGAGGARRSDWLIVCEQSCSSHIKLLKDCSGAVVRAITSTGRAYAADVDQIHNLCRTLEHLDAFLGNCGCI